VSGRLTGSVLTPKSRSPLHSFHEVDWFSGLKQMILHLNNDLLLSSAVRAAANQAGTQVQFSRNLDDLATALQAGGLDKVLIDLQTPGLDLQRLQSLVSQPALPPVVMYAQHVNEELLSFAANLPGVSVMTRGQFSRSVSKLIGGN
jgi:hypothetical protein